MARAGIVVKKWVCAMGWQHDKGFPGAAILAALAHATLLENQGTPVRVYERTPGGPKVVYESPRP